jgi:hypothetical protein
VDWKFVAKLLEPPRVVASYLTLGNLSVGNKNMSILTFVCTDLVQDTLQVGVMETDNKALQIEWPMQQREFDKSVWIRP